MADNFPTPPIHQSLGEQPTAVSSSTREPDSLNPLLPKKQSFRQNFLNAFLGDRLYDEYEPHAKSIKIVIQMFIGIILGFALLLKVFADIFNILGNPLLHSLAILNPLDVVAYGLFFSTGIDLAYMLFTDGPDEAIDPLMTGLAAVILLGIGTINFEQIQQGITLILAVGALAALFATKKYLYIHPRKKVD